MSSAAWKLDLLDRMAADHHLTSTDFRVAFCLLSHRNATTGDCFAKQETVAAQINVSERGVRLAISNLRIRGWLRIESRPLPKGRGRINYYVFEDGDRASSEPPTGGTSLPVEGLRTGTSLPVEELRTGTPAQNDRNQLAGPSLPLEEPFKKEPVKEERDARKRASPAHRGTRLPDDFVCDRAVALRCGLTPEQVEIEIVMFTNYWRGEPGAKGFKLDWAATWQNWCLREVKYAGTRSPKPKPKGFFKRAAEASQATSVLPFSVVKGGLP